MFYQSLGHYVENFIDNRFTCWITMEVTSKTKHFSFKSKKLGEKNLPGWFVDNIDDDIEIDEPNKSSKKRDVTKTPVRQSDSSASPISQNSSPQFRVGWNEGSQKSSYVMSSPVSVMPARRKIRRCPENLRSKIIVPNLNETKIDEENCCDILQCINFAKSIIESPNFQASSEEDDGQPCDDNIIKITESIKDTSLDILDDSSNELMILCSQAVEESISAASKETAELSIAEKHSITPNHDRNASKRFKSHITPKDVFKNQFNVDSRFSNLNQKSCISHTNNFSKRQNFQQEQSVSKNQDFVKPHQLTYMNNNNSSNCKNSNNNLPSIDKSINAQTKKPPVPESSIKSVITALPSQPVTALSNDDIKSHLDDEDDLFCSLDFNFLDKLQTQTHHSSQAVPKLVINTVNPPVKNPVPLKLNTKSLVTKYTKEEIEKRRIEAKKRLLFNKKHRSM